jgi:hypothetical protein
MVSINIFVRVTIPREESAADEVHISIYYEHFYRNEDLRKTTAIHGTKILIQSLSPDSLEVRLM